jgi:D-glycero-D-manno-heptose 1,7-bisphosphate phosphatase
VKNKALFLDRDGVINHDFGYVHRQEDFIFIDGILDLVAAAKQMNFLVIVVTNQAGIGRGYYTEEQFHSLMHWVGTVFEANNGKIDRVYFCPDHPTHGVGHYKKDTSFRKPGPGMLLQAAAEMDINMAASYFIGDKPSDMAAGFAARVGTLLYFGDAELPEHAVPLSHLKDAEKRLQAL